LRALRVKLAIGVAVLGAAGVATAATAGQGPGGRADLSGFEEVPAISTDGEGTFRARIAVGADEISYELSYSGLSGDVQQSHIHLGQQGVNGGISVFLCSNLGNGPEGTQACPGPREGNVSGTIAPDDVIGPTAQGIAAGEYDELVRAIRAGATYVNVHTVAHPGGEIRKQLRGRRWR
jgi:CHRD domain